MKVFNYGFKFLYRKAAAAEQEIEYIMFSSKDPDIVNACEVEIMTIS